MHATNLTLEISAAQPLRSLFETTLFSARTDRPAAAEAAPDLPAASPDHGGAESWGWTLRPRLQSHQVDAAARFLHAYAHTLDVPSILTLVASPHRSIALHAKRRLRRIVGKLLPKLETPVDSPVVRRERREIEEVIGTFIRHADADDVRWLRVLQQSPLRPLQQLHVKAALARLEPVRQSA